MDQKKLEEFLSAVKWWKEETNIFGETVFFIGVVGEDSEVEETKTLIAQALLALQHDFDVASSLPDDYGDVLCSLAENPQKVIVYVVEKKVLEEWKEGPGNSTFLNHSFIFLFEK